MLPNLSIVIPCYNEADRIAATLAHIAARVFSYARDVEVIIVDDGSSDRIRDAAFRSGMDLFGHERFQYIRIPHTGKGKAVQTGVMAATKEWIVFMDADNSTTIDALGRFLPFIDSFPIVIGSRAIRDGSVRRTEARYRHWIGKTYNRLMRWFLGIPHLDTQCGFKLFRRTEARALFSVQRETGFAFDTEAIFRARQQGMLVKEAAVDWTMSARSSVKVLRDSWRMFCSLLRIRWRGLSRENRRGILIFLTILFFIGAVFAYRATALRFSLPDGSIYGHTRSYFQDEDAAVADTAKLIAAVKQNPLNIFDPGPTVYPVFGGLLSTLPLGIAYVLQYRGVDVQTLLTASPQAQAEFYSLIAFSGRLVSFASAFLSILVFYFLAKELTVKKSVAGWLSFVYAWMPVDILLSIEAKTNALLNLLLLLILLLAIRWSRLGRDKRLFFASVLAGMALGTRLNGFLGVSIIFFAVAWKFRGRIHHFFLENKKNFIIFILPFLGLLVSSPHLLAHPSYIHRMWSRAGSGSLIFSLDMAWENIFTTLRMTAGGWVGLFLLLFAIGYGAYALIRGSVQEKILASWFFFYLFIFAQTTVPIIRYAYPLLPLWLLLLGIFATRLLRYSSVAWTKIALWGIMLGWGASVVVFGLAYMRLLRQPPLQHAANAYIEQEAPAGAAIGTYFNEEFYLRVPIDYSKYRIFSCRDLEEGIRSEDGFNVRPDYLVVPWRGVECMTRVFDITGSYERVASFTRDVSFGPFTFDVAGAGAYRPTAIEVYKRREINDDKIDEGNY